MGLTDLLKSFTRSATLGIAMYACGGSDTDDRMGCRDDYDCREPRVCVQGYCEDTSNTNNNNNNDNSGACGDSPFNDRYLTGIAGCGEFQGSLSFDAETCTVRFGDEQGDYSGTQIGPCNYLRDFSCSEVTRHPERCDAYQCALSENNDFYIRECGNGVSLMDNLYTASDSSITQSSCERILNEPWYSACFGTGEP